MNALILAGGLGTRLRSVTGDHPKALVKIANKPFIDYQIEYLRTQGVDKLIFALGFGADELIEYLEKKYKDVYFSIEKSPLGTGGAIKLALQNFPQLFNNYFLIANGDSLIDIEVIKLYQSHCISNPEITVALVGVPNCERFGSVILEGNKIISFGEKNKQGHGLINAGYYISNPDLIKILPSLDNFSFEKDILSNTKTNNIFGFKSNYNFFIDIGTPTSYKQLNKRIIERGDWK